MFVLVYINLIKLRFFQYSSFSILWQLVDILRTSTTKWVVNPLTDKQNLKTVNFFPLQNCLFHPHLEELRGCLCKSSHTGILVVCIVLYAICIFYCLCIWNNYIKNTNLLHPGILVDQRFRLDQAHQGILQVKMINTWITVKVIII